MRYFFEYSGPALEDGVIHLDTVTECLERASQQLRDTMYENPEAAFKTFERFTLDLANAQSVFSQWCDEEVHPDHIRVFWIPDSGLELSPGFVYVRNIKRNETRILSPRLLPWLTDDGWTLDDAPDDNSF